MAAAVRATRADSEDDLHARARAALGRRLALGVTRVEAKSGYGLNVADERKTLRVYERLAREGLQRIVPTCLGAHIVLPEFAHDRDGYLLLLEDELIPSVPADGLARFFDVFVEETAFSPGEAAPRGGAAARAGRQAPRRPAQRHRQRGFRGRSGHSNRRPPRTHLDEGIARMAKAGVVAVSLPIAMLVLGAEPLPARRVIEAGVPLAVATDFNPGSAPSFDLHVAAWLACTRQRMTPHEVLKGLTAYAAQALGLDEVGSLAPGFWADVAVLDAPSVEAPLYAFRLGAVRETLVAGRTTFRR